MRVVFAPLSLYRSPRWPRVTSGFIGYAVNARHGVNGESPAACTRTQ
jgi:hypothetical protein